MDIESKIIDKFNEIKKLGFVKNNRPGNDGGVGNTFEDYLEVDENNQTEADFENFEVKSKRQFTKSYMSLYTKKPTHPENGDNYMRETFGVYDEEYPNIKVLRTSIYAHRWSLVYKKLNIKLKVDKDSEKIIFCVADLDFNVINEEIYWTFDDIYTGAKKLNDLFVVNAETKILNGEEYYFYKDALVYIGFKGIDKFIELIEKGKVRYDNRLGVYRTGKKKGSPHNHGGGFRISPKDIHELYHNCITLN